MVHDACNLQNDNMWKLKTSIFTWKAVNGNTRLAQRWNIIARRAEVFNQNSSHVFSSGNITCTHWSMNLTRRYTFPQQVCNGRFYNLFPTLLVAEKFQLTRNSSQQNCFSQMWSLKSALANLCWFYVLITQMWIGL